MGTSPPEQDRGPEVEVQGVRTERLRSHAAVTTTETEGSMTVVLGEMSVQETVDIGEAAQELQVLSLAWRRCREASVNTDGHNLF